MMLLGEGDVGQGEAVGEASKLTWQASAVIGREREGRRPFGPSMAVSVQLWHKGDWRRFAVTLGSKFRDFLDI